MARSGKTVIRYAPRRQFVPYHDRAQRFACIVAHRRAGKTVACVNDLIRAAARCELTEPRFAYVAPFYNQAKNVAWSYLKRFAAPIAGTKVRESELYVELPNSARVRLYGADYYDRLRGAYLDGVVLDEYADMDPRAWSEAIGPMLADRKGWATFIGTPRGRNGFFALYEKARGDADWFSVMLKASETGLIPEEELTRWRAEMTADQYAQEFECSFQAAVTGAYYGKEMARAESEARITSVPYDAAVPVHTAWDLGIDDSTAIWFAQVVGREVHLIDFYEASGEALGHYANVLRGKPYSYGDHFLPHDAEARELGTGKTRTETLASLGLRGRIVRRQTPEDGINAARLLLPRCWFDAARCARGVEALRQYRRDWDDRLKSFRQRPLHDWASHGADAFRYLALSLDARPKSEWPQPDAGWIV